MNGKIEELIEEATTRYDRLGTELEGGPIFNKTKFAKLVVRECLQVIDNTAAGSIHSAAGPWNSALAKCKTSMCEYFGVTDE